MEITGTQIKAIEQGLVSIQADTGAIEMILEELESEPVEGLPLAAQFRLPLANAETKEWYEATRRYGPYNHHPEKCEDWNLESGGKTDLGEPLVAPFSGLVLSACDWRGSVGRVVQILGVTLDGEIIVWGGWHMLEMFVEAGQVVRIGDAVGSVGDAGGYYAGSHLHEQICMMNWLGVPRPALFPGSDSRYDWRQPSQFWIEHGIDAGLVTRCSEYGGIAADSCPGMHSLVARGQ